MGVCLSLSLPAFIIQAVSVEPREAAERNGLLTSLWLPWLLQEAQSGHVWALTGSSVTEMPQARAVHVGVALMLVSTRLCPHPNCSILRRRTCCRGFQLPFNSSYIFTFINFEPHSPRINQEQNLPRRKPEILTSVLFCPGPSLFRMSFPLQSPAIVFTFEVYLAGEVGQLIRPR